MKISIIFNQRQAARACGFVVRQALMRVYNLYILILFLTCLFLLPSCKPSQARKKQPKITKGILDMKGWDFEKDGPVTLAGEWKFYWHTFLSPRGETPASPLQYTAIPSKWNGITVNGKPIGGQGFGTYQLRILLPETSNHSESLDLGFKLDTIGTSYALYINGELLVKIGEVGENQEDAKPAFSPVVLPLKRKAGVLEILCHVSNFEHARGGLWGEITVGPLAVLSQQRENNLLTEIFLCGALLLIGAYHLGLYALRRNNTSPLYFALFCFFLVLRTLLTGEMYIYQLIPNIPWEFGQRIEYLTLYLSIPVFLKFLASIFPEEVSKRLQKFLIIPSSILSSIVLLFPPIWFTRTLIIMEIIIVLTIFIVIYTLALSLYRKRQGAFAFFIGWCIFCLIIINDLLYTNNIIATGHYSPFGFLIFVFSQAFFLSIRSSQAFLDVEELSENLEKKVAERTLALQEATKEIGDLNSFSHSINSLSLLDDIFFEISRYVFKNYRILGIWLFLPDENKKFLYAYKIFSFNSLSEEQYRYAKNQKVPMNQQQEGMLFKIYLRKKPFYLRKIPHIEYQLDREFTETLSIKSLLYVPLIRKNECVGIIGFSNLEKPMKLTKKSINRISNLCSQISGAIHTNHLLQQLQKEKKKTEKAILKSDRAREEAEIQSKISRLAQMEAQAESEKSEKLLLNILPFEIAQELKEKGTTEPVLFASASVLFTDFKGFTQIAETLTPEELVKNLDTCFGKFDKITEKNKLEKLKTIGDSYMCAGGIPNKNTTHPIDSILAALEIQNFMNDIKDRKKEAGLPYWEIRLGIHTGPLVAGVIGEKKFVYDVWEDTVNIASRMESSGTSGKINISGATYKLVKHFFVCEYRGKIKAKNKGEVDMYYVNGIKSEFSKNGTGKIPNSKFWQEYVDVG
ncbi:MAG: adenylate/guanylate cyclase domain-containing protein [Spirochaetota bacterium]